MSQRIEEILSVIKIVKEKFTETTNPEQMIYYRKKATKKVADNNRIEKETIRDKYIRQLKPEINGTNEFDNKLYNYLKYQDFQLRNILLKHSVGNIDKANIEEFFKIEKRKGKGKKESTMTVHKAACKILEEEQAHLSSKEIASRILRQNWIISTARNPNYSIAQTIEKNIRERSHLKPKLVFLYDENKKRKIWFETDEKNILDRENKISINNVPGELMKMIDYETKEKKSKNKDEVLVGIMKRGLQEIMNERKRNLENQLNQINNIF